LNRFEHFWSKFSRRKWPSPPTNWPAKKTTRGEYSVKLK
jgi:hypothetical protein